MQCNRPYHMHTCQRIETACEAKHPLRNFIFNAIFHSVDSIFCLITTFLPSSFLSPLGWHMLMKNLSAWSAYADSTDWVAVSCFEKKEWKQYRAALSESQFLRLTNAFHLHHVSGRGYQSQNGPYLNPSIHSIKQREEESKGGQWIFKEL